jgi:hypothetical protein
MTNKANEEIAKPNSNIFFMYSDYIDSPFISNFIRSYIFYIYKIKAQSIQTKMINEFRI